jgi:hypothetical protein
MKPLHTIFLAGPGRFAALKNLLSAALLLTISCERPEDTTQTGKDQAVRQGFAPLLETSYEMETFAFTEVLTKGKNPSGNIFERIDAQPRLEKRSHNFKIFEGGAFELTTIEMEPENKMSLPAKVIKNQKKSQGSYKIVVSNGVARFYARDGRETGSYRLKTDRFPGLAADIKNAKPEEVAGHIAGHPLINRKNIMAKAKKNNAEISEKNKVTRIKYDLDTGLQGTDEDAQKWAGKYLVQLYDFEKKRLLKDAIYDKKTDRLISRADFEYNPVAEGNQVRKITSEFFEEDPASGLKLKHVKNVFYANMKVSANL